MHIHVDVRNHIFVYKPEIREILLSKHTIRWFPIALEGKAIEKLI